MSHNDLDAEHLETLDRDLGRYSNLEQAASYVGRPFVGLGLAFIFIVVAGLAAGGRDGARGENGGHREAREYRARAARPEVDARGEE